MARPRKHRLDLPKCVYFRSNAYYYVTSGIWMRLGKTYGEAMKRWAELVNQPTGPIATVNNLLDRYALEVIPGKSERTQKDNQAEMRYLRAFFGAMGLQSVKTSHVAQYIASREAKIRANREIALLSHAFNKAIMWGLLESNPCSVPGVRNSEKPRERYVSDAEVTQFKTCCPDWLKLYIELKLLLGLRKQDMIALTWEQLTETAIFVPTKKTGAKLSIDRNEEVNSLLDLLPTSSGHLFQTRTGEGYSSEGFDSAWQRAKNEYVKKGGVSFHEHDLRGKVATDMNDLAAAKGLLGHTNISMTEAYVKAKSVQTVQPATRKKA
jgi:integrase